VIFLVSKVAFKFNLYHYNEDFKHSGMVTLCTTTMYMISAFFERIKSKDTTRKGAWRDYVILAAMTSTGEGRREFTRNASTDRILCLLTVARVAVVVTALTRVARAKHFIAVLKSLWRVA
jgi:hypothetical protein